MEQTADESDSTNSLFLLSLTHQDALRGHGKRHGGHDEVPGAVLGLFRCRTSVQQGEYLSHAGRERGRGVTSQQPRSRTTGERTTVGGGRGKFQTGLRVARLLV